MRQYNKKNLLGKKRTITATAAKTKQTKNPWQKNQQTADINIQQFCKIKRLDGGL